MVATPTVSAQREHGLWSVTTSVQSPREHKNQKEPKKCTKRVRDGASVEETGRGRGKAKQKPTTMNDAE